MDWEGLRERTLGDVATVLVAEGGGTAAGFIGGAFVGRQIQNLVKKDDAIVDTTDKLLAWGANNIPKLAIWWMARGYRPSGIAGEAVQDARKAFAGSVVFDTAMRLANAGKNPATANLWGYQVLGLGEPGVVRAGSSTDIQKLMQENGVLRTELNKALQRLAEYPGLQPIPPEVAERQRKYAQMEQERLAQQQMQVTPPAIQERERRFATMSPSKIAGFTSSPSEEGGMATMCGFL